MCLRIDFDINDFIILQQVLVRLIGLQFSVLVRETTPLYTGKTTACFHTSRMLSFS